MKMAYILFDKMTTLDFVGFYEAVTWMGLLKAKENVSWDFCSNKQQITDDRGLTIQINHVYPDLSVYDTIFIPVMELIRPKSLQPVIIIMIWI